MQISEEYVEAYIDLLRTRVYTIVAWWFVIAIVCGVVFSFLHEFFGVSILAYGASTLTLCALCVHLLVRQQQRRLASLNDSHTDSDERRSD